MYNLFAEAHKAKASSHLHFSPTNKALSIPSPSTGEGAGLGVLLMRIIRRIMQAATFLSLNSPSGHEICGIDHIAELTYIPCCLHALAEFLCLLIEYVKTSPCPL